MMMQEMMKMNRNDVIKDAQKYKGYQGNPNTFTRWYSKDNKTHVKSKIKIKIFKNR